MNRTANRLFVTTALMLGATLAAAFSAGQAQAQERALRVATLPKVEIVARRDVVLAPRVVELPRVTITGKRPVAEAPTRVAQKPAPAAPRS